MSLACLKSTRKRQSVKQLLGTSTRIACLSGTTSSDSRINIDNRNFGHAIGEFLKNRPELGSLPIEISCVLGYEDQPRRQLHTDWLIQYFQSRGNKEKSVKEWISHWNTSENLKFVDSYVPDSSRKSSLKPELGVYIWPKPLIKRDEFNNKTLRCVLYVVGPEESNDDVTWLDVFIAGAASKIVTFDNSEKNRLIISTKAILGHTLTEENFINMWTSRNFKSSMDIFLDKFEKKPIKHRQLKDTYENVPLTLNNLESHLETVAGKINEYRKRQESQQQENKSVEVNNTNLPKVKRIKTTRHDGVSVTTHDIDTTPIPVGLENHGPISLITPGNVGSSIAGGLNTWIHHTMTLANIYELQDHFSQLRGSEKLEGIHDDIIMLQNHIDTLNNNFKNMYDNYVCFDGDLDLGQMHRFMVAYGQQSLSVWKASEIRYPNIVTCDIVENANNKLCFLYLEDNKMIINQETKLVRQICETFLKTCKDEMANLLLQNIDHTLDIREFKCRVIIAYCISTIGRTLDFYGKLNNVARREIKTFRGSLDQTYKQLETSMTGNAQLTKIPEYWEHYDWYSMEMQQAFYCQDNFDPNTLKRTHDILIHKLTEKMEITDRSELKTQLDSLFVNMIERELVREESDKLRKGRRTPNTLTFYITNKFIHVYYSVKGSGTKLIIPSNDTVCGQSKVGISEEGGDVLFGNELVKTNAINFRHIHRFLDYFERPDISVENLKAVIVQVFLQYKNRLEKSCGTSFSQINVVISNWLSFEDRLLVRESCREIGFKKICVLMESSIAAYKLLNEAPSVMSGEYLVLVVNAVKSGVRMELYGKQHFSFSQEKEDPIISLMAVCDNKWLQKDKSKETNFINTIKATYTQIISQLTDHQKNSVIKYVSILERSRWNRVLDSYLQNVEKIDKAEDLTAESLLPIVDQFANRKHVLENFLQGLCKPFIIQSNPVKVASSKQVDQHTCGSQQVSKRNKKLYDKCESIEEQLIKGKVKVGMLRKKIILEIIERGKVAAEVGNLGDEEEEIDELCKLYDFKY